MGVHVEISIINLVWSVLVSGVHFPCWKIRCWMNVLGSNILLMLQKCMKPDVSGVIGYMTQVQPIGSSTLVSSLRLKKKKKTSVQFTLHSDGSSGHSQCPCQSTQGVCTLCSGSNTPPHAGSCPCAQSGSPAPMGSVHCPVLLLHQFLF